MHPVTEKVFLDNGLLSELLSFLSRPCDLDPVCKPLRAVMSEVAGYRVQLWNTDHSQLDTACRRVKNIFEQIRPRFFETATNRFGDHVTELMKFRQVEIFLVNGDAENTSRLAKCAHNIVHLSLCWTRVRDVDWSFLGLLTKLHRLSLSNVFLTNISGIATLQCLKYLNIGGCPVSDLTPIEKLESLEDLGFDGTAVTCIYPIRNLVRLRALSFLGTSVKCIDILRNLQSIASLRLSLLDFAAASDFPEIRSLRELIILGENNMNAFREQRLDMSDTAVQGRNRIRNTGFLLNMTELEDLSLRFFSFRIISIDGLQRAAQLRRLDISCTHVADLTGIISLQNLESLQADQTMISDISPLCELKKLRLLTLQQTQVCEVTCLRLCSSLRRLKISQNVRGFQDLTRIGVVVVRE